MPSHARYFPSPDLQNKDTPLHWAAIGNLHGICRILAEAGAVIDARGSVSYDKCADGNIPQIVRYHKL